MNPTDTPRTDAATELYGERPFMVAAVPVEFAEGLERELTASKAEVERLKADLRRAIEIGEELTCLGLLANFPTELITRK